MLGKQLDSVRVVARSDAAVANANFTLDEETKRLGREAAAAGGAALVTKLLGSTPSDLVKPAFRRQCEITRDQVAPALRKLGDAHPLFPWAARIETLASAGMSALDGRARTKGTAASGSDDIEDWKDGVNRLRTVTHGQLVSLGAQHGKPDTWVESFFPVEDDVDGEAEAPAAPPTPTPATPISS